MGGKKQRKSIHCQGKPSVFECFFAHDTLMYKRIHLAWKWAGNDLSLTLYSVSEKNKNDENITPCMMRVLCKAWFRLEPDREKLREQSLLPGNKAKRKIPKPLSSKLRWKSIRNYISVLQTCGDQGWEGFMGLLTSVGSSASKEKLSMWHNVISFTKSSSFFFFYSQRIYRQFVRYFRTKK